MKVTIEIDDNLIPDGYKAIAFTTPHKKDFDAMITKEGDFLKSPRIICQPRLMLEKLPVIRRTFELVSHVKRTVNQYEYCSSEIDGGDILCWYQCESSSVAYYIWKVVEEK